MNNDFILSNYKNYISLIEDINEYSNDAVENFLNIGRCLKNVKENELYKLEEYNSIYEFAFDKFGYKETSVKNFINCFEKYSENPLDLENYSHINEDFKNYQITSLVELLPVPVAEIKEEYNSDMTIKEIRQRKVINNLSEEFQKTVNRYHEVLEILKKEMDNFNSNYPKDVVEYNVISDSVSIDDYKLACNFKYRWRSFYLGSDLSNPLNVDYLKHEFTNEEIIEEFHLFLSKVKEDYDKDLKSKETKKIENEKKKLEEKEKKALPYVEKSVWSLRDDDNFILSIFLYLEYVVLKSNKDYYDLVYFEYKDSPLYEYPIIYNDVRIGSFLYDKERKEVCFKLICLDKEVSSNPFKKKENYSSLYCSIDSDDKRCDLFNSNILIRFQNVYDRLKQKSVKK